MLRGIFENPRAPTWAELFALTRTPRVRREYGLARKLAAARWSVLIMGESNVGKLTLARAIHALASPAGASFVPLNVGAMPRGWLAHELFGDALAGPVSRGPPRLAHASGGTLYLCGMWSLDDLPRPDEQQRLARAVREGSFTNLEGRRFESACRLIVAANPPLVPRLHPDLLALVEGAWIYLPPLRERLDDLALVAQRNMDLASDHFGKPRRQLSSEVVRALRAHSWPGNFRELDLQAERWAHFCPGPVVESAELGPTLR